MPTNRNKCLHVLNIYALKHLVKSKKKHYPLNILIMCSDNVTDIVAEYRQKIFCICKIELSYKLKFNTVSDFEFSTIERYNNEITRLSNNAQSTVKTLSEKMLDYIKIRRHNYIYNIIEFKNEKERDNNVQVFINYYNNYAHNRKVNINNSLEFITPTDDFNLFDPLPKKIEINNIIDLKINPNGNYFYNLYLSVMHVFLTNKKNISPTPVYNLKKNLISDFELSKRDNFHTNDYKPTINIVNYLEQLLKRYIIVLQNKNLNENLDFVNNKKYLKIERDILQAIVLDTQKNKIASFLNLNSSIYYVNTKGSKLLLMNILNKLFILLQYGGIIKGLKDK